MVNELVAQSAGMIVDFAFASSIKSDQKRFEKAIAKLDAKKQQELLLKVQQIQNELERQKIVFQYIDKAKIEELKKQENKKKVYIYIGLSIGLIAYTLIIFKLKKR